MKQPIAWHKECLSNIYKSLERKKARLEQLQAEVDRDAKSATFYHVQVHEAETAKEDGFDSDLYLKNEKHFYVN